MSAQEGVELRTVRFLFGNTNHKVLETACAGSAVLEIRVTCFGRFSLSASG